MSRTTTKVLALTAASGLAMVGFFLTKPAFAGTNGQQLLVCQRQSEDYTKMHLEGANQDGVVTSATFSITPTGTRCGVTHAFYWSGEVEVELDGSKTGVAPRSAICNVPKEHPSDLYACNA
jgi:hypothetical protein